MLCAIGEGGSGKTSASIATLSDLAASARKSETTNSEDTNRNRNSVVSDVTADADADAKSCFPVFVALPPVKQYLLHSAVISREEQYHRRRCNVAPRAHPSFV